MYAAYNMPNGPRQCWLYLNTFASNFLLRYGLLRYSQDWCNINFPSSCFNQIYILGTKFQSEESSNCIDVDECALNTFECEPGHTCKNIYASYRCIAPGTVPIDN